LKAVSYSLLVLVSLLHCSRHFSIKVRIWKVGFLKLIIIITCGDESGRTCNGVTVS
jgi:hypothetical protein